MLLHKPENRNIPKMRSQGTHVFELRFKVIFREKLDNFDFVLAGILVNPIIPLIPNLIGSLILLINDGIILRRDFFVGVGTLADETADDIIFGDGGGKDGNNDGLFAETVDPFDILFKDGLIDLFFLVEGLIVADEVEIDLAKEEEDGLIWGLSNDMLYFFSFIVLFLDQPFDRLPFELIVLHIRAVQEHLDERIPKH